MGGHQTNTVHNASAKTIGKVRIAANAASLASVSMVNPRKTVAVANVVETGLASIAINVAYIVRMESQITIVLGAFALGNGLGKSAISAKCHGHVGMEQCPPVRVILASVQRTHSGRAASAMFVGLSASMGMLKTTAGDASVRATGAVGSATNALWRVPLVRLIQPATNVFVLEVGEVHYAPTVPLSVELDIRGTARVLNALRGQTRNIHWRSMAI